MALFSAGHVSGVICENVGIDETYSASFASHPQSCRHQSKHEAINHACLREPYSLIFSVILTILPVCDGPCLLSH